MGNLLAIRFVLGLMALAMIVMGCGVDPVSDAFESSTKSPLVSAPLSISIPSGPQAPPANAVTAAEQAKWTANDAAANDSFGGSIAISGDTAVVGASSDDVGANANQGSVYVFTRIGTLWTQQAKLVASDGQAQEYFGSSVAIEADTLIVGASEGGQGTGTAYVFTRSAGVWTEQAKLVASDGAAGDGFGVSVALSGDTALVGAYLDAIGGNPEQGSAYVFTRSAGVWTEQAKLVASTAMASGRFGRSVALSGDRAIVGAPRTTVGANTGQGAAYAFVRNQSTWLEQSALIASDGNSADVFGDSVAIAGDTLIVGATGAASKRGAAYVFTQNGSSWLQQAKLVANDGASNDYFGQNVAISGDTAIVGAFWNEVSGAFYQGSAYLFSRSGGVWVQQIMLTASDGMSGDWFGRGLALSGDTALVGATRHGIGGAAYAFTLIPLGASCSTALECPSGFCVDGVCCDSACTDPCKACSSAIKNQGEDGLCGLIAAGAAPRNAADCPGSSAESCGLTGMCDGAGQCQHWPSGTACGGSCVGTVAIHNACTGTGICASSQTECAPFLCQNSACTTTCSTNADCAMDAYCDLVGASCKNYLPLGAACGNDEVCLSGNCVDGVCCNSACAGACQACSADQKGSGADGYCGSVAEGTICGPSQCFGNVTKKSACDAFGTCMLEPNGMDCQTYPCDPTLGTCATSCTTDADCVSSAHCAQGSCVADESVGTSCTADAQCTSGSCIDGFCCDMACTGLCSACSMAKTNQPNGTCAPVAAHTDPDDECSDNLACDGAGACKEPIGSVCASEVDCISGFCVDGVCCDAACGGDTPDDCQACSMAAGAIIDGVCALRSASTVCRATAGVCDQEEVCTGVSAECPMDAKMAAGSLCRDEAGECDAPETCNGTSNVCPPDDWAANGTVCSQGVCISGTCTTLVDGGSDGGDGNGGPDGNGGGHASEHGACNIRVPTTNGAESARASLAVLALMLLLALRRTI